MGGSCGDRVLIMREWHCTMALFYREYVQILIASEAPSRYRTSHDARFASALVG